MVSAPKKMKSGEDRARHRFGLVPEQSLLAKLSIPCRACFDLLIIVMRRSRGSLVGALPAFGTDNVSRLEIE